MSIDSFASVWTLNRATVFAEAMELAKTRSRDAERECPAARQSHSDLSRSDHASCLPVINPQAIAEPRGGLAIRIAAMVVGVVALSAFAAFGIAV